MIKRTVGLLAAVVIACVACCADAFAAQDASQEWDSVAASYSFTTTMLAGSGWTFADSYYGCPCDFESDFARIIADVADLMGTQVPIHGGDDIMIASLQNWPDS